MQGDVRERSRHAKIAVVAWVTRKRRVRFALLVLAVVTLAGCSLIGSSDDEDTTTTTAAADTTEGQPDETETPTDDTAAPTEEEATNGSGNRVVITTREPDAQPGEAGCEVIDGGTRIAVSARNAGTDPADLNLTAGLFDSAGTEVGNQSALLVLVRPGEVAITRDFIFGVPEGTEIDSCTAAPAEQAPSTYLPSILNADSEVGECQNFGPGATGPTFEVPVNANRSRFEVSELEITYGIIVAVIDGAGVRQATAVIDSSILGTPVVPDTTTVLTTEVANLDYTEDMRCEVFFTQKFISQAFFTDVDDTGAQTGSLDADVGFGVGSAELTEEAFLLLADVAAQITEATPVCVEGFADSVGSDEDNLALSQARAEAVAEYLRAVTPATDITAIGRGESEATEDEVDDPTLRRVDITLAGCPG